jgi:hypothetical protein
MQHAASQIRRYPKKLQGETETLGEKFYSKRLRYCMAFQAIPAEFQRLEKYMQRLGRIRRVNI